MKSLTFTKKDWILPIGLMLAITITITSKITGGNGKEVETNFVFLNEQQGYNNAL